MKSRIIFLIISSILLMTSSTYSQNTAIDKSNYPFKHYAIQQGLSQNSVFSIIQDRQGFLWFGTQEGLNRYDGYNFKVFKRNIEDENSLSDNNIRIVHEDKNGYIWIGTENGLNRYNPWADRFERFYPKKDDKYSISNNKIQSILPDRDGAVWVGTQNGLNKYNPYKRTFTRLDELSGFSITALVEYSQDMIIVGTEKRGIHYVNKKKSRLYTQEEISQVENVFPTNVLSDKYLKLKRELHAAHITAIFIDGFSREWIGTDEGLKYYNGNIWKNLDSISEGSNEPRENFITSICEVEPGILWIGTQSGLNIYDIAKKSTQKILSASYADSISNNDVQSLLKDHSGVVWIGTYGGGINKLAPLAKNFRTIKQVPGEKNSLQGSTVWSILEDKEHNIWIGTYNGGITKITPGQNYIHYSSDRKDKKTICSNDVRVIEEDGKGNIWIGTSEGLNKYLSKKDRFQRIKLGEEARKKENNNIQAIEFSRGGFLWIGTRNGFCKFNPISEKSEFYKMPEHFPIVATDIRTILEDSEGEVWLGTFGGGLIRFNPENSEFTPYTHDPGNNFSISHNRILCIYESMDKKNLWIGTDGGGLNCLSRDNIGKQNGRFKIFYEKDGLTNGVVYGILEDNQKNLWLSTNGGLFRFSKNEQKVEFKNFDVEDGIQDSEFDRGAYFKGSNNLFYFGGVKGVNVFDPAKIIIDNIKPKISITNLWINNKPSVNEKYKRNSLNNSLMLSPNERMFAFEFAALHYANPSKHKYQYKLEGWDQNWLTTDANNRRATYTNIPPGDYTFIVKGSNRDGLWSNELAIPVTILPSIWRSGWAYAAYLLGFVFLIFSVWKFYYITKMAHRLREVDQMKDSFLSNTSHELKTPIHGIIGLAETLKANPACKIEGDLVKKLDLIIGSGKRLDCLVNDIMDLSRMKKGKLELHKQSLDLYSQVNRVFEIARHFIGSKNLELINSIDPTIPPVEADEVRLQQILQNLIQNAIKFTEKGKIEIFAEVKDDNIVLSVSDTGIGVPEDKFEKIFQTFQQLENPEKRSHQGAGLGLAITRDLVELHGGKIWVTSRVNEGSSFYVSLPIAEKKEGFLNTKIISTSPARTFEPKIDQKQEKSVFSTKVAEWENRFRILIVEDDPLSQQIIRDHLALEGYRSVAVSTGQEALVLFKEEKFDLILLDIMMPGMSGFDVCELIRKEHPAHELPIIFLTARGQDTDQNRAFITGANDFIAKPVSREVMLNRVRTQLQLLESTRNLEGKVEERTLAFRNAQAQLVQSEKMASLGFLISGIAHEINNPTSYMKLATFNLERALTKFKAELFEMAEDEAENEILETFNSAFAGFNDRLASIHEGVSSITNVVHSLKTFYRQEKVISPNVDILPGLNATISLVKTRYKERIVFVTSFSDLPRIAANLSELNQVFMNLLINGCQAIEAKQKKEEPFKGIIAIRASQQDREIRIEFEDNGIGIPENIKKNIFDPFFTTKNDGDGTGLGLSICYNIIKKHGGSIQCESTPGKGAMFSINLPIEGNLREKSISKKEELK